MFEIFQHNIRNHADKITILRGTSREQLKLDNFTAKHSEFFDIIYIDGDHTSASVLEDAILAWPLLKRGGTLIFDDFYWGDISSIDACYLGINFFLSAYEKAIRVVEKGYQVCLIKL
jgi:predicted O-methyltransferase YrrM